MGTGNREEGVYCAIFEKFNPKVKNRCKVAGTPGIRVARFNGYKL